MVTLMSLLWAEFDTVGLAVSEDSITSSAATLGNINPWLLDLEDEGDFHVERNLGKLTYLGEAERSS